MTRGEILFGLERLAPGRRRTERRKRQQRARFDRLALIWIVEKQDDVRELIGEPDRIANWRIDPGRDFAGLSQPRQRFS